MAVTNIPPVQLVVYSSAILVGGSSIILHFFYLGKYYFSKNECRKIKKILFRLCQWKPVF
jgi:hypothetical protein